MPWLGHRVHSSNPLQENKTTSYKREFSFASIFTTDTRQTGNQAIPTKAIAIPGKERITDTSLVGKQIAPLSGSDGPFEVFWPGIESLSIYVSDQPGIVNDAAVAFSLSSLSDNDAKGIFVTLISPHGVRVPISGTYLPENYLAYEGIKENPRDTFNLKAHETRSYLFGESAETSDNFRLSPAIRKTLQESRSKLSLATISSLHGASGNGEWQLEVKNSSNESIQLNEWQLFLKTGEDNTLTDNSGKYVFDSISSSNIVGSITPWIKSPNNRSLLSPAGAINTKATLTSPSAEVSFGLSAITSQTRNQVFPTKVAAFPWISSPQVGISNPSWQPETTLKNKTSLFSSIFSTQKDRLKDQQSRWNRFDHASLINPNTLHPKTTLNQAVTALNADAARVKYGVDGTGVKMGIISNSYNEYGGAAWDYNLGVLDESLVQTVGPNLDGLNGKITDGEDEGRAMIQNIHSIAPGAETYFASWYDGYFDDVIKEAFNTTDQQERDDLIRQAFIGYSKQQEKFRNLLIEFASKKDTQIIVDDVGDSEPWFEDGPMAEAIQFIKEEYDVSYFTAAGNYSNNSYQHTFNPIPVSELALATENYDGFRSKLLEYRGYEAHQFTGSSGSTLLQEITGQGFATQFYLQWNDKWGKNTSKVKVLTFDKDKNFASEGLIDPDGIYPWASFKNPNATSSDPFYIAILHTGESAETRPDVIKWVGNQSNKVSTNSNNGFFASTAFGHANSQASANVGSAQYWSTPAYRAAAPEVSRYSSWGATPIYFDSAGNKLSQPVYRQTPMFITPQKGDTTFFSKGYQESQNGKGDQFESDLNYLQNFEGTSAAAPNTAAVAALMLQLNPSLSPDQIFKVLRETTSQVQTAGLIGSSSYFSSASGFGLINAMAALDATAQFSLSGYVYEDTNRNGALDSDEAGLQGITVFLDSNGNRQFDSNSSWQSFSSTSDGSGKTTKQSDPTLIYDTISGLWIDSRYGNVINGPKDLDEITNLEEDSLLIAKINGNANQNMISLSNKDITLDGDLLIQFEEESSNKTGFYTILRANSISESFDNILVSGLDPNLFVSIGIQGDNNILVNVSDQHFVGSTQADSFY